MKPDPVPTLSLLAHPPIDECKGLRRVADTPEGYSRYACLKCGTFSGNDWSQCRGHCPSEQSPHFDPECLAKGSSVL